MAMGGVLHPNNDVGNLSTAVDDCFDTPLSCLSREELADRLVVIEEASNRLDALRIATVAAGESADVASLGDQRNVANYLAERTGADPKAIRADQRVGKWLQDFPEFADAYRQGKLSTAHIELLRRKDNARVHGQMIDDQRLFIRLFSTLAFRDLDVVMERWLLGADPDGAEPDEQAKECGLSLKVLPGGMLKIDGTLDPLMAGAFKTAVLAEAERIRQQHKAEGITSTVRRRNLEALMALVTTGFATETRNGAKTLINIVIDQDTYEETLDWLQDPDSNPFPDIDIEPKPEFEGRKSQLLDGTPIHPLYAIAASMKAVFRRVVYDPGERDLHYSYDSRSFPEWIATLTRIATNGKSANPICDAPFHWLQTDHVLPHSRDGETTYDNARPLSGADNGWRSNDTERGTWPKPETRGINTNPSQIDQGP